MQPSQEAARSLSHTARASTAGILAVGRSAASARPPMAAVGPSPMIAALLERDRQRHKMMVDLMQPVGSGFLAMSKPSGLTAFGSVGRTTQLAAADMIRPFPLSAASMGMKAFAGDVAATGTLSAFAESIVSPESSGSLRAFAAAGRAGADWGPMTRASLGLTARFDGAWAGEAIGLPKGLAAGYGKTVRTSSRLSRDVAEAQRWTNRDTPPVRSEAAVDEFLDRVEDDRTFPVDNDEALFREEMRDEVRAISLELQSISNARSDGGVSTDVALVLTVYALAASKGVAPDPFLNQVISTALGISTMMTVNALPRWVRERYGRP